MLNKNQRIICAIGALFFLLLGCATAHRMSRISLGMTKTEVFKTIGPPTSVSAKDNIEYLNYHFIETENDYWSSTDTPYFVRLIDGKVESYGRLGDFDSTKVPETKSAIDINIKENKE